MADVANAGLPAGISLRPITTADMAFLFKVYASTREEELAVVPWTPEQKVAFLGMQFQAQHSHYQTHYADASFQIVQEHETPIGRLYVHRSPSTIMVMDIALMPEYRGKGLGSTLMKQIQTEAREAGKTVKIYVEQNNRALSIYRKLGFVQTGLEGVYFAMEWHA